MNWLRPLAARSLLLVTCTLVLLAGCATAPSEYREPPPLAAAERTAHNLRVFERTWELVNEKYFDARFRGVDWPAMRAKHRPEALAAADDTALYRALNRLCAELKESHLAAIAPRRAYELRTEHRASVGFRLQLLEDRRVVTDVVPRSPAAIVGVETGWLAVSRNGAPIQENSPYIPTLGQPVTYGFVDAQDQPHSLTMEPQLINFDQLVIRELPGGYLYLRFDEFSRKSLHWLSEQLKAHASAPGIVLDLRYNPGGNMLALNVALAEFFPKPVNAGRMVKRSGRERENQSLSWLSARYAGRIAILTDKSTGSAAEIFSHVLQQYKRATVIGQGTAGAVIVSRSYALPGGGRLQVPVSDYIGLDGHRLEGRGVTPDVASPVPTLAQLRAKIDPDIEVALQILQQTTPQPSGT